MINGLVNDKLEACIRVFLPDALEIETVIDTGYDGYLTLPAATVQALGLQHFGRDQVELGDGSLQVFELYLASIVWDGQTRTIVVDAAETTPLIGTALLSGYDFSARFVPGGSVSVTQASLADDASEDSLS